MYIHKELGERRQNLYPLTIYRLGHDKLLTAKRKMQSYAVWCDSTVVKVKNSICLTTFLYVLQVC